MTRRSVRAIATLAQATLLVLLPLRLSAQGGWDAVLTIDPYPSPYYSDWDANPNLGTLTVTNGTQQAEQIRIHYNVVDQRNRVVAEGVSESEAVGAGATAIFHSPYTIEGSSTHDSELESIAARTGRLPEGEYTTCVSIADESGFVLAESCAAFTIVYPDPPLLLEPGDGDVIDQTDPLFVWTPVQVPIDFQLAYVFRVVEILEGQTPADALRSNIPQYQTFDAQSTNLRYPLDARPLEHGKTYAWSLQALDQNGYAASANDGRSEIRTFSYGEPAPLTSSAAATLTLRNDGSSSPADTVRGLNAICASWDAGVGANVDVPVQVPFAWFPRVLQTKATLVRETLSAADNHRVWALYGSNDRRTQMLFGDCDGLETRKRWLGIRTVAGTQELTDWIPGDTTVATDSAGTKLKFGVVILALREEAIGGEEAIAPVREFLEDREIEIKPGVNLFGVLDAKYLKVWPLLEALGHDPNTAEIELQGFAGINVNASAELRGGSEERTASLGATAEYVTVRGAMPERHLAKGPFKTVRAGIELTFGDSLGVGKKRDLTKGDTVATATSDYSHHLGLKLTLSAVSRRAVNHRDITWNGALEWDWNLSDDEGQCFACATPTLRLTTDHQWQPFEAADLAVGNPEIAIGINDGLLKSLKALDFDSLHADVTLRGSLIWHDEDVAKVAVTFGRHAANAQSMERTEARIKAAEVLDSLAVARMNDAEASGDSAEAASWRQKHRDHVTDIGDWKRQLRADSLAVARARHDNTAKAPQAASDKGWYWKASLTLGNMGLGNFLDFSRSVGRAVVARIGSP